MELSQNLVEASPANNEKVFISTQDFRERAIKEDYEELQRYINGLPIKTKGFPCDKYNFSYTSASNLLKPADETDKKEVFSIQKDSLPSGGYVGRTITLKESTLKRLDAFCEEYDFYSKQSIVTLLLEEALNRYE